MNEVPSSSLSSGQRIDEIVGRFEGAWRAGQQPRIEDYLANSPDDQTALFRELLRWDLAYQRQAGKPVFFQDYRDRFPQWAEVVDSFLQQEDTALPAPSAVGPSPSPPQTPADPPAQLGRYRVTGILGKGGFGIAYRGFDDELQRDVAIKVPRRECLMAPEAIEEYVNEARVVAQLDHPHIVSVYDVGRTGDGLFFVVSRFIEGSDLKARLAAERFSCPAAAGLVAAIAEALHYAHRKGLVHRDVKPANILLDRAGKAYLADFGLVLKEEDFGKGADFAGTPAYMSPEQARREGHRVDGRSDIFSLGVVFYEMLTGRRPFQGQTQGELLDAIVTVEARPPRQIDDAIPRELERICLKALAKRAADRYTTALDLAEDLKTACGVAPATPGASATPQAAAEPRPVKIVPKGLRSFDAGDADFFLELLPGPRDRAGLPEGLRFWKTRLEESDPDRTFAVGLLYGPSGCGKSSLVKAGLLPRLAPHVVPVYVEATAEDTETRLLKGLRKQCPALDPGLSLVESIAALRRGSGKKVVLLLDQFEQWLHARRAEDNPELVQALRQCDGGRVQAVVMVRDDFWLAVSRFMTALEVDIRQGDNTALVDLFDPLHARKVLAEFGKAFGRLPDNLAALTREQEAFLDQAITGLAQDGKVISVRLALFADMVKGKPWEPMTLRTVGGIAGVGVTFLEETFSATTANPRHRLHQQAARAVLRMLLPEQGTDIKGNMCSQAELLAASGLANRPRDFAELLRILDGDLRLITPTDPEAADETQARSASEGTTQARSASEGTTQARSASEEAPSLALRACEGRFYQLTHDYLVPSLRDWLTRKQRETRRGRAELRLAERAALWTSKPQNRLLPRLWEWANIRLFTRKKNWTPPQRRMMGRAGRYHAIQCLLLTVGLTLLTLAGWWTFGALRARHLVDTLLTAKTADVPEVVHDLESYRRWADPLLREQAAREDLDDDKRLHVALALLPVDPGQTDYLCDRLLAGGPDEVKVIRESLHTHAPGSAARFWPVLEKDGEERSRRLRAACVLAQSDGDDPRWAKVGDEVVRCLAGENILLLREWAELLAPVRAHLIPHQVRRLVEADAGSFPALVAMLRAYPDDAAAVLHKQLERSLPADAKLEDRQALARQQALAAVALLHLGRSGDAWPLFHQEKDPTGRTYLIHRCAALGVDPAVLASGLLGDEVKDSSIRQGLLLALGEYTADQRAEVVGGPLVERVQKDYGEDLDPGVHSAAEWLLRQWNMMDRLPRIEASSRPTGPIAKPRWWVNGQRQTFAVIPAPAEGEVEIGSPPDEIGRVSAVEDRRKVQIDYSFAVATKLVTVAEFKKFRPDFPYDETIGRGEDVPIHGVTWYDAARYCNDLSKAEKVPPDQWCYEPNAKGEYAAGMKLKANYLKLSGYRLPREVEWEHACRAGTMTAWAHGSDEAMLGHYAWYSVNANSRMHPAGSLKPNGLGLFDMSGNAYQWCQEKYQIERDEDNTDIIDKDSRVLRGGSWGDYARYCRSANRSNYASVIHFTNVGCRVCFRLD